MTKKKKNRGDTDIRVSPLKVIIMGLDMYFYCSDAGNSLREEIAYFRKHSDLHGWLEDLWKEKGNEGPCNCEELPLTEEDLRRMRDFAELPVHPKRTGFFWGESRDEQWEATRKLVKELLSAVKDGKQVIYRAWY